MKFDLKNTKEAGEGFYIPCRPTITMVMLFGIDPTVVYEDDPEKAAKKSVMFIGVYSEEDEGVRKFWSENPERVISFFKEILPQVKYPYSPLTMEGSLVIRGMLLDSTKEESKKKYAEFFKTWFYPKALEKYDKDFPDHPTWRFAFIKGAMDSLYSVPYIREDGFYSRILDDVSKMLDSGKALGEVEGDENNKKKFIENARRIVNFLKFEDELIKLGYEIPPISLNLKKKKTVPDHLKVIAALLETAPDRVVEIVRRVLTSQS